tara:strand:+ start:324 stop:686 length:363 start_codon:yes stop_codon:yes gene_type:complete
MDERDGMKIPGDGNANVEGQEADTKNVEEVKSNEEEGETKEKSPEKADTARNAKTFPRRNPGMLQKTGGPGLRRKGSLRSNAREQMRAMQAQGEESEKPRKYCMDRIIKGEGRWSNNVNR